MGCKNYHNKNQKLPVFGIGPYLILAIALLSVIGIILTHTIFTNGAVHGLAKLAFNISGVIFILIGMLLWYFGALKSDINKYITNNKLKTNGVFSWTRNPMYSGWWAFIIGIMFLCNSIWLILIIPIQWLILTLVLRNTEEKWLYTIHGEEYRDYCKKVNRLIPFKR